MQNINKFLLLLSPPPAAPAGRVQVPPCGCLRPAWCRSSASAQLGVGYCLSSRRARHNTTLDMETSATGAIDSEPQVTSCIAELQTKIREDFIITALLRPYSV